MFKIDFKLNKWFHSNKSILILVKISLFKNSRPPLLLILGGLLLFLSIPSLLHLLFLHTCVSFTENDGFVAFYVSSGFGHQKSMGGYGWFHDVLHHQWEIFFTWIGICACWESQRNEAFVAFSGIYGWLISDC